MTYSLCPPRIFLSGLDLRRSSEYKVNEILRMGGIIAWVWEIIALTNLVRGKE
jgi:hypothetical protein